MLRSVAKLFGTGMILLVICGAANATVFRDRAAFNAASQNRHVIDFESVVNTADGFNIDGVVFQNPGSMGIGTQQGSKVLLGNSVGEFTRLTIFLPPGTTAVGCDQFSTPMIVSISTGENVMMNPADASTFVGFVSDQPIQSLVITLDFPEPTPAAVIDNLTYGQRLAGNEPPVPQLLTTTDTARALALDSVTTASEPFHVLSAHNFAVDGHTRITLLLVGVALEPADAPFVTVQAEDAQQHLFNLPVEATSRAKELAWISQVTVRLPDTLPTAVDLNISVTVRGKVSNKAPLRIE
ncbi:MAG TPA: hypothetical protein VN659_09900 [Pyrinomonadaceae bacterium]|nr:hypothetical protein [Pyrinomonadaceae bacterium]